MKEVVNGIRFVMFVLSAIFGFFVWYSLYEYDSFTAAFILYSLVLFFWTIEVWVMEPLCGYCSDDNREKYFKFSGPGCVEVVDNGTVYRYNGVLT